MKARRARQLVCIEMDAAEWIGVQWDGEEALRVGLDDEAGRPLPPVVAQLVRIGRPRPGVVHLTLSIVADDVQA